MSSYKEQNLETALAATGTAEALDQWQYITGRGGVSDLERWLWAPSAEVPGFVTEHLRRLQECLDWLENA